MAILYKMAEQGENRESELEHAIRDYIKNTKGDDYTAAIREDRRFAVWYHLSDLRVGLFNWYDFRPGASLLEIGAGFGALTGDFCRRCAQVTAVEASVFRAESIVERYKSVEHLTVYAGEVTQIEFRQKFDYIVLVGGLECAGQGSLEPDVYAEYILGLKRLLKPDGIMLVAVDNRYALRSFCGEQERYTGLPFAGISGLAKSTVGRAFSRHELIEILQQAKVETYKFYYPLPDYRLPQLIYTDEHLPEPNVRERMIPYYADAETLLLEENELYDDVIANDAFPFLANSYLVECGAQVEKFSSVVYAALSTDRGRERAFATVIYANQSVRKLPMYASGIFYAKAMLEKVNDLKRHGIPMLEQNWDGRGIEMAEVKADTLSNYLKKAVYRNPAVLWEVIEELWQYILQSSEQVSQHLNAMGDGQGMDWGPILKKAYLELIPLNCFFEQGRFLFFDQEYVRENYPAKYVLFRAIHYIYIFSPRIELYVPLQAVKEKYGLTELWDIFLQEEDGHFLPEVRQRALYQQFYCWAQVNREQMAENAKFLGHTKDIVWQSLFADSRGKDIIIFGAGALFDDYLRRYGQEFPPVLLLDNNKVKWGMLRSNVKITAPQELTKRAAGSYQLIICSRYYKEIAVQLYGLGIQSFRIYPYALL